MIEQLANPEIWIALATLTALELVLGIDNIIFISILAGKLPPAQRNKARNIGILLAAVTRLALLMAIAWIVGLTAPLFSLDSIITAVGMVDERWVMVTAILVSIVFMLAFARPIGEFVEKHPTVKILALAFLIMIGLVLVADGFGHHIPKGYIYAAMAFSVFVEMINLWVRRRAERGRLQSPLP